MWNVCTQASVEWDLVGWSWPDLWVTIWKRPHFCMNSRFLKGAGGGQGAAQWLTSAVFACEPETREVYVYTPTCWAQFFPTRTRVFRHESYDMFCNNGHYGEGAQVLDTVKQCWPFRDPTGISVIFHSSSYWDPVWVLSYCCWPLWKVTMGLWYEDIKTLLMSQSCLFGFVASQAVA